MDTSRVEHLFPTYTVHFQIDNPDVNHPQSITFTCKYCAREFIRTIDDSANFIILAPMPEFN